MLFLGLLSLALGVQTAVAAVSSEPQRPPSSESALAAPPTPTPTLPASAAPNVTHFVFPTAQDWWVRGAANNVSWEPVAVEADLYLFNSNRTLLSQKLELIPKSEWNTHGHRVKPVMNSMNPWSLLRSATLVVRQKTPGEFPCCWLTLRSRSFAANCCWGAQLVLIILDAEIAPVPTNETQTSVELYPTLSGSAQAGNGYMLVLLEAGTRCEFRSQPSIGTKAFADKSSMARGIASKDAPFLCLCKAARAPRVNRDVASRPDRREPTACSVRASVACTRDGSGHAQSHPPFHI